jgi:hypothetical protein
MTSEWIAPVAVAYLPPTTPPPLVERMIENALHDVHLGNLQQELTERLKATHPITVGSTLITTAQPNLARSKTVGATFDWMEACRFKQTVAYPTFQNVCERVLGEWSASRQSLSGKYRQTWILTAHVVHKHCRDISGSMIML